MRRWLIALVVLGCKSSSPSAPPSNTAGSSKPEPPAALLPAIDTTCTTDADCDHAYTYEIDGKCCDGTCSPKPAAKTWITNVAEICQRAGFAEDNCPTKKCAAPPPIACIDGQCRTR